ncbi:WhiB family transcriptional regulator [Cellulomonas rhizosphaerae]|uniref:WhiB family transcriptional regulator n=1 Tax=Cellulomonas rhizosphaerae TaxID=2293719 RepID=UPI0026A085DD|nr:WhiB family transcriptional regulator [Cellulomonas rhizosphaerae]
MRLTTLLDTDRTGSGPWPTAASTTTTDERFDQLVADFIPCRSGDPELWFAEQTTQVEQAKALCRECPLLEGCLAGAIERAEPWGVWGGEVFIGGVVVATKRGRGRPRKNAVVA